MQLEENTLYVVGPTEFNQMAVNRIRELEQSLCGVIILKTELIAASTANGELPEETAKEIRKQFDEYARQIAELRARIDAIRSLTDGELDVPKGE